MSQLIEALRDAAKLIEHLGGNAKRQRAVLAAAEASADEAGCTACVTCGQPVGAAQAQPLKARPDFIAGYDAGLADGRRCAERDAAETQPAPEVPDAVQDALALVLDQQFKLGMNASRNPRLTPAQCKPAADALLSLCDTIKEALAAPVAAPQWQRIDTAPDRTPFKAIVATRWPADLPDGEFHVQEAWWNYTRKEWWPANVDSSESQGCAIQPTHWMPLPAAPGAAAPAAPQAQPLSRSQMLNLMPTTTPQAYTDDLLWFGRAVERAHRIGSQS